MGTDETPLRHQLENQRSWWNRVPRRPLSRRGAGVRLPPRSTGLPSPLPLLPQSTSPIPTRSKGQCISSQLASGLRPTPASSTDLLRASGARHGASPSSSSELGAGQLNKGSLESQPNLTLLKNLPQFSTNYELKFKLLSKESRAFTICPQVPCHHFPDSLLWHLPGHIFILSLVCVHSARKPFSFLQQGCLPPPTAKVSQTTPHS